MSARVLLVDDIEANRRMLAAKLAAEYFQVSTAENGPRALDLVAADPPDIILLDVMMPGMDGYAVLEKLKADPESAHIPVVFVSALEDRVDRIRGLELGADDFLTKPVDAPQLIARMRSLTRMKVIVDELRSREASGRRLGVIARAGPGDTGLGGRVLVVDDDARQRERLRAALVKDHTLSSLDPRDPPPDLAVISIAARSFDPLSVIAQLRSAERSRGVSILCVARQEDPATARRALDLGANDLIYRPVDLEELSARVRTLIRRQRAIEAMRSALDHSLELAVTDPLTGLHNRRFMTAQLQALVARAARGGDPVSAILIDIDHFKAINDTHGHAGGDAVLKEFAERIAGDLRAVDIACRYGGEEFVVVMPGTRGDYAALVAERLRRRIAAAAFRFPGEGAAPVTASFGVATAGPGDSAESLLKRADEALYRAKSQGRNRVIAAA